ncbi:hypothetical protein A7A21_24980 (plasmid) [Escherichia coli]|uniref:hypothetical protein n=1 Tax=Escherichia coli TaxID=562 RepID=UPI00211BD7F4|nr:hypothetical protein [Escherichia coli]UUN36313.1 hypothetical protein A7A21_24980 [Escherichia coli]UUN40897.1 hypothetical protein A7A20_24130 [Escherichia coli]
MFIDDKLKSASDNKKQLLGWEIIRNIPYHLIGIYSSKEIALRKAGFFEKDYEVVLEIFYPKNQTLINHN